MIKSYIEPLIGNNVDSWRMVKLSVFRAEGCDEAGVETARWEGEEAGCSSAERPLEVAVCGSAEHAAETHLRLQRAATTRLFGNVRTYLLSP